MVKRPRKEKSPILNEIPPAPKDGEPAAPPAEVASRKSVGDLLPHSAAYNPRRISEEALAALARSMREFGDLSGIVFNRKTGNLIGGHQRLKAFDPSWKIRIERRPMDKLGTTAEGVILSPFGEWSYREVSWPEERERLANLAANRQGGEWDDDLLGKLLADLKGSGADVGLTGFLTAEIDELLGRINREAVALTAAHGILFERFLLPPFSVIDARSGWWLRRRRAWIALGLKSEEGRGRNLLRFSKAFTSEAYKGTSIFDPVLAELLVRWFSPPGGSILDPFAGGSCRGAVSAALGREYLGFDLSAVQVAANQEQWSEIRPRLDGLPNEPSAQAPATQAEGEGEAFLGETG